MKTIPTAFAVCLSTIAYCQKQEGQTCLFTCLHHLDTRKSVRGYIQDYNQFTLTRQDIYDNGVICSPEKLEQFIRSEFDALTLGRTQTIMNAIDSGYAAIAIFQFEKRWPLDCQHAILIQGYHSTGSKASENIQLIYYDPYTGYEKEEVSYMDILLSWQIYCVALRVRR